MRFKAVTNLFQQSCLDSTEEWIHFSSTCFLLSHQLAAVSASCLGAVIWSLQNRVDGAGSVGAWKRGYVGQILAWVARVAWVHKILAWVEILARVVWVKKKGVSGVGIVGLRSFVKKVLSKFFATFTGKHLSWSLFLNKVQAENLQIYLKRRFQHRFFLVNFEKSLRTLISRMTAHFYYYVLFIIFRVNSKKDFQ